MNAPKGDRSTRARALVVSKELLQPEQKGETHDRDISRGSQAENRSLVSPGLKTHRAIERGIPSSTSTLQASIPHPHQTSGKRAYTPTGCISLSPWRSSSSSLSPSPFGGSSLYGTHGSSASTSTSSPAPTRLKRQSHSTTSVACQTRSVRRGWPAANERKRVV